MLRFGFPVALALLLPSCGAGSDALVFCSYGSAGNEVSCDDYNVSGDVEGADVNSIEQSECTSGGGTVVGSCSTTSTLGTCTLVESIDMITLTTIEHIYAANGLNASQAEAQCLAENGANGVSATWSTP
jgi:hypothetical protein